MEAIDSDVLAAALAPHGLKRDGSYTYWLEDVPGSDPQHAELPLEATVAIFKSNGRGRGVRMSSARGVVCGRLAADGTQPVRMVGAEPAMVVRIEPHKLAMRRGNASGSGATAVVVCADTHAYHRRGRTKL